MGTNTSVGLSKRKIFNKIIFFISDFRYKINYSKITTIYPAFAGFFMFQISNYHSNFNKTENTYKPKLKHKLKYNYKSL